MKWIAAIILLISGIRKQNWAVSLLYNKMFSSLYLHTLTRRVHPAPFKQWVLSMLLLDWQLHFGSKPEGLIALRLEHRELIAPRGSWELEAVAGDGGVKASKGERQLTGVWNGLQGTPSKNHFSNAYCTHKCWIWTVLWCEANKDLCYIPESTLTKESFEEAKIQGNLKDHHNLAFRRRNKNLWKHFMLPQDTEKWRNKGNFNETLRWPTLTPRLHIKPKSLKHN